jgi:hypothetical protein
MAEEGTIGTLSGRLKGTEEQLIVTITGDVYARLKSLSDGKMRNAQNPKEAVELALELLIQAEGKEIALIEGGKIVATYNLWR